MKYEKLFEIADNLRYDEPKTLKIKDKEYSPKAQTKVFRKAIQAFIHKVATGVESKAIQAFSGSTDLPKLTKDVFNVTTYDMANLNLDNSKDYYLNFARKSAQ